MFFTKHATDPFLVSQINKQDRFYLPSKSIIMDHPAKQAIAELFMQAGKAHHQAFLATDGDDPEWPIWYAEFLQGSLSKLLGVELTKSRIVYELIRLDEAPKQGDEHWSQIYAEDLIKKYTLA
jgi:hypothetical protein